jgi:hypothetical protein
MSCPKPLSLFLFACWLQRCEQFLPHTSFFHHVTSTHRLYFYFSLFILLQIFIRSWCSKGCPKVCPLWVYFALVHSNSLITLSYPLPLPHTTNFSTAFSAHPWILYLHILCYVIQCSIILFSFPSFSQFHTVVLLFQTYSTSEFVYDHACFCAYMYLWIYLPVMREII